MTKKIFGSIFIPSIAVILASLIIILGVLYEYFTSVQERQLRVQTVLAAQAVENEGMSYFDGLETKDFRLTWVGADGTVLYDSDSDATTMENHAEREEIKEALEAGFGESERTSKTLAEKTLYRAQLLDDGTVLRLSVTQYTVGTLLMGMIQPLCVVLLVAIILSAILASRLSKRIVEPLNDLDLDRPLENDTYDELSPILNRIERQHRQIDSQMAELRRKQDELSAVTESMSEGLILLNEKGVILSINPAAAKLFRAGTDSVGKDILTVDRSTALQKLVGDAQKGTRGEKIMELGGGQYQLVANPVISDEKAGGVVILAFDITEKMQAETLRREFSANVSHELKTPLQSIMGSAELIENGLVKPEDMQSFAGRIRTEASRLVTLIDDIIRLSQLDENGDMPKETVDLLTVSREAVDTLSAEAASRGVVLTVGGESAEVFGVRRLLFEIAYNLCDNAIKYNVENGRVDVTISCDEHSASLTVSDTGIGIPKEHHAHVFERFYRVDKSHSKATGGTGLGLSIVKHAAMYHGASIDLSSETGKGTTITVKFPR